MDELRADIEIINSYNNKLESNAQNFLANFSNFSFGSTGLNEAGSIMTGIEAAIKRCIDEINQMSASLSSICKQYTQLMGEAEMALVNSLNSIGDADISSILSNLPSLVMSKIDFGKQWNVNVNTNSILPTDSNAVIIRKFVQNGATEAEILDILNNYIASGATSADVKKMMDELKTETEASLKEQSNSNDASNNAQVFAAVTLYLNNTYQELSTNEKEYSKWVSDNSNAMLNKDDINKQISETKKKLENVNLSLAEQNIENRKLNSLNILNQILDGDMFTDGSDIDKLAKEKAQDMLMQGLTVEDIDALIKEFNSGSKNSIENVMNSEFSNNYMLIEEMANMVYYQTLANELSKNKGTIEKDYKAYSDKVISHLKTQKSEIEGVIKKYQSDLKSSGLSADKSSAINKQLTEKQEKLSELNSALNAQIFRKNQIELENSEVQINDLEKQKTEILKKIGIYQQTANGRGIPSSVVELHQNMIAEEQKKLDELNNKLNDKISKRNKVELENSKIIIDGLEKQKFEIEETIKKYQSDLKASGLTTDESNAINKQLAEEQERLVELDNALNSQVFRNNQIESQNTGIQINELEKQKTEILRKIGIYQQTANGRGIPSSVVELHQNMIAEEQKKLDELNNKLNDKISKRNKVELENSKVQINEIEKQKAEILKKIGIYQQTANGRGIPSSVVELHQNMIAEEQKKLDELNNKIKDEITKSNTIKLQNAKIEIDASLIQVNEREKILKTEIDNLKKEISNGPLPMTMFDSKTEQLKQKQKELNSITGGGENVLGEKQKLESLKNMYNNLSEMDSNNILDNIDSLMDAYVKRTQYNSSDEKKLDSAFHINVLQDLGRQFAENEESLAELNKKYEDVNNNFYTKINKTEEQVQAEKDAEWETMYVRTLNPLEKTLYDYKKAFKNIGDGISGAATSFDNEIKQMSEQAYNTGLDIGNKLKNGEMNLLEALVESGKMGLATVEQGAVTLVYGFEKGAEGLVDTAVTAGVGIASLHTSVIDAITGNFARKDGITTKMYDWLDDFVSTEYIGNVKKTFDETGHGKWLNENSLLKNDSTISNVVSGAGEVLFTVATGQALSDLRYAKEIKALKSSGLEGKALNDSIKKLTGAYVKAATTGAAGAKGYGRYTEIALNDGADSTLAKLYGLLGAGWEMGQWSIGHANDEWFNAGLKDSSSILKSLGIFGVSVAADAVDSAAEGVVQPILQTVYKERKDNESFWDTYVRVFKENGGWEFVGQNGAIGTIMSATGKVKEFSQSVSAIKNSPKTNHITNGEFVANTNKYNSENAANIDLNNVSHKTKEIVDSNINKFNDSYIDGNIGNNKTKFDGIKAKTNEVIGTTLNKVKDTASNVTSKTKETLDSVKTKVHEVTNSISDKLTSKLTPGKLKPDIGTGELISSTKAKFGPEYFAAVVTKYLEKPIMLEIGFNGHIADDVGMYNTIKNEGLLHFTDLDSANKIISSGNVKPTKSMPLLYDNNKAYFFAGKPPLDRIAINSDFSSKGYLTVMTAVKIKPTDAQLYGLKYRYLDDLAVTSKGGFKFDPNQAEIVYYGITKNADGNLEYQPISKDMATNYDDYLKEQGMDIKKVKKNGKYVSVVNGHDAAADSAATQTELGKYAIIKAQTAVDNIANLAISKVQSMIDGFKTKFDNSKNLGKISATNQSDVASSVDVDTHTSLHEKIENILSGKEKMGNEINHKIKEYIMNDKMRVSRWINDTPFEMTVKELLDLMEDDRLYNDFISSKSALQKENITLATKQMYDAWMKNSDLLELTDKQRTRIMKTIGDLVGIDDATKVALDTANSKIKEDMLNDRISIQSSRSNIPTEMTVKALLNILEDDKAYNRFIGLSDQVEKNSISNAAKQMYEKYGAALKLTDKQKIRIMEMTGNIIRVDDTNKITIDLENMLNDKIQIKSSRSDMPTEITVKALLKILENDDSYNRFVNLSDQVEKNSISIAVEQMYEKYGDVLTLTDKQRNRINHIVEDLLTPVSINADGINRVFDVRTTKVKETQNPKVKSEMGVNKLFEDSANIDGKYGVAQGLFTDLKKNDPYLYSQMKNKLMKEYKLSEIDADRFMETLDSAGACNYAAEANTIFSYFKDNPTGFEQTFGFPMYRKNVNGDLVLNDAELLADIYYWGNAKSPEAVLFYTDELGNTKFNENAIKYKNGKTIVYQRGGGMAEEYINGYLKSKGSNIECNVETLYTGISKKVEGTVQDVLLDRFNSGKEISMVSYKDIDKGATRGIKYIDVKTGKEIEISGHWTKVTDITNEGIIVSSWGRKCLVKFEDLEPGKNVSFFVANFKNGDIPTIKEENILSNNAELKNEPSFNKSMDSNETNHVFEAPKVSNGDINDLSNNNISQNNTDVIAPNKLSNNETYIDFSQPTIYNSEDVINLRNNLKKQADYINSLTPEELIKYQESKIKPENKPILDEIRKAFETDSDALAVDNFISAMNYLLENGSDDGKLLVKSISKLKEKFKDFKFVVLDKVSSYDSEKNFININRIRVDNADIETTIHELGHALHTLVDQHNMPENFWTDIRNDALNNMKSHANEIKQFFETSQNEHLKVWANIKGEYSQNQIYETFEAHYKEIYFENLKSKIINECHSEVRIQWDLTEERLAEVNNLIEQNPIYKKMFANVDLPKKYSTLSALKEFSEQATEEAMNKSLSSIRSEYMQNELFEVLDKCLDTSANQFAAVSEMLSGLAGGMESFGESFDINVMMRGHSDNYYSTKPSSGYSEFVTEYSRLKFTGQNEGIDLIRYFCGDEFVNTLDTEYNKIIDGLKNLSSDS